MVFRIVIYGDSLLIKKGNMAEPKQLPTKANKKPKIFSAIISSLLL